jgi:protein-tyrosine phosphatase
MRPGGRPGVSAILPELLVGEYPNPQDATWLRDELGVTAVVCLQDEADLWSKDVELPALRRAYAETGIGFHHVPVPDCDTVTLDRRLEEIVSLLDALLREGARVYLHCNGGLNRAPTAAIAYLHVHRGLSLHEARDHVKQYRHCAPFMTVLEARFGAKRA